MEIPQAQDVKELVLEDTKFKFQIANVVNEVKGMHRP